MEESQRFRGIERLPQFREFQRLVRVIPVAQTHHRDGITVTVTTLDCYERHFYASVYIWRDADDDLVPVYSLKVLFDGVRPVPSGSSGPIEIGTPVAGTAHHRSTYWFYPPPDPSVVREVQLIIPVIHLVERRPYDTLRLVADVVGPWTFTASTGVRTDAESAKTATIATSILDWAWANPERVAEYRAQRLEQAEPHYGPLYDAVLDAIYRYDPHQIGWKGDVPFGAEEYSPEADSIVPRLVEARSVEDVRRVVYEVLGTYHGATVEGEMQYAELAEEIWQVMRMEPPRG